MITGMVSMGTLVSMVSMVSMIMLGIMLLYILFTEDNAVREQRRKIFGKI